MLQMPVNYLAILAASVASMIIGGLWYSPVLFAKKWMALTGMTEDQMKNVKPGPLYAQAFVAALVTYFVMAHFVSYAGANTFLLGAKTGFWCWLGFITTVQFTNNLFSTKPIQLYVLDTGYQLVTALVAGAILGVWK